MLLRSIGALAILAGLSTAAVAATASKAAPTLRDQEQAACYDDATKLCNEFVPDEQKIATCMRGKIDQVSAGCRKFFK